MKCFKSIYCTVLYCGILDSFVLCMFYVKSIVCLVFFADGLLVTGGCECQLCLLAYTLVYLSDVLASLYAGIYL